MKSVDACRIVWDSVQCTSMDLRLSWRSPTRGAIAYSYAVPLHSLRDGTMTVTAELLQHTTGFVMSEKYRTRLPFRSPHHVVRFMCPPPANADRGLFSSLWRAWTCRCTSFLPVIIFFSSHSPLSLSSNGVLYNPCVRCLYDIFVPLSSIDSDCRFVCIWVSLRVKIGRAHV